MRAARETWLNPVLALALCAAGGTLAAWGKVPLPWMIGPLLVMAVGNSMGAQLRSPRGGRQVGQLVIATALGLYFTPEVAHEVARYWSLLLLSACSALILSFFSGWIVSRTTAADWTTAFFASVPGGAAEMAVQGERYGARVDRIALAQSLRIMAVVVVVPFGLTLGGSSGAHEYSPAPGSLSWPGLALLLLIGAAAGGVLARLRAPNAFMLGPLFVVGTLTASQISLSVVPSVVSSAGQLLLGCALGSQFKQGFLRTAPRFVFGVLLSIMAATVLAALIGAGLALAYALPIPTMILATAPGGIAEMCITAQVLLLGVPLVTAAHVARVLVLVSVVGPIFGTLARGRRAKALARVSENRPRG